MTTLVSRTNGGAVASPTGELLVHVSHRGSDTAGIGLVASGRTWLGPVMVSVCITASSERGQMIARIWRGWASQATAGDYQSHYETEVSRHLQDVKGFCGARLLRCDDGQEVMFTSVAFFTGIDAVRSFAGEDYEQAIVEEAARRALNRWDERVSHHDVSVDLPGAS